MSKAASDSLSQHYQLAIAQHSERQHSSRPAAPQSSPHQVLSPHNKGKGTHKPASRAAGSALPASVQAKVSTAMQKVLAARRESPMTPAALPSKLPDTASLADASSLETGNTDSQSELEPCSDCSDTALSLAQQAVRVKASAEAVLHGIDWATSRAHSVLSSSPASCQRSRQSSSATCSSPDRSPQPEAHDQAQCQLLNAVSNANTTKLSSAHDSHCQQNVTVHATTPSKRPDRCSKARHAHHLHSCQAIQQVVPATYIAVHVVSSA